MSKNYVDGWGKPWKYSHVPEYIKELNRNPIGIINSNNGHWFARELKINNGDFKIDVLHEGRRMFTDDLKYGPRQEIIFDKDNQCFTIKDLDKLRADWRKDHPEENVMDNVFEKLMEVNI